MKKSISILILVLASVICFSACGVKSNPGDLVVKAPYKVNQYLTLGNYKGVEVKLSTSSEVTSEDLQNAIKQQLLKNATGKNNITDRAVQKWDTVNIDYEGLVDGVAFDGGTATGQDLTIGSGSFIDGFEDGLIGAAIGETRAVNAKFPDVYTNNPDLAGKDAVFNVKINSITENVLPEYNDEYVKTNYGYDTIAEYEENYLNQLKDERSETVQKEKENLVWPQIINNSTVKSYPQDVYDSNYNEMYSYYENMATQYGMTIDNFVKNNKMTMDQFKEKLKETIQEQIKNQMVAYAILKKEKINISAEDLEQYKADILKQQGFKDEEEFISSNGKSMEDQFGAEKLEAYYVTVKASAYCASVAKVID